MRIFHLFAEKPLQADLHEILHDASSGQRNQLCQILSLSGFDFVGVEFLAFPRRKEKSPLTQGLNYRSTDINRQHVVYFKEEIPVTALVIVRYLMMKTSIRKCM